LPSNTGISVSDWTCAIAELDAAAAISIAPVMIRRREGATDCSDISGSFLLFAVVIAAVALPGVPGGQIIVCGGFGGTFLVFSAGVLVGR
jgi:hypothetical protein